MVYLSLMFHALLWLTFAVVMRNTCNATDGQQRSGPSDSQPFVAPLRQNPLGMPRVSYSQPNRSLSSRFFQSTTLANAPQQASEARGNRNLADLTETLPAALARAASQTIRMCAKEKQFGDALYILNSMRFSIYPSSSDPPPPPSERAASTWIPKPGTFATSLLHSLFNQRLYLHRLRPTRTHSPRLPLLSSQPGQGRTPHQSRCASQTDDGRRYPYPHQDYGIYSSIDR
jgi:hypothetical protein